jgi:hypothetical protein
MKYIPELIWMLFMVMAIAGTGSMLGYGAESVAHGTILSFLGKVFFDLADIRRILEKSR